MKKLLPFLAVLLCSLSASAQFVGVNAQLVDGSGANSLTSFLRFSLFNCGANLPVYSAGNLVVIKKQFDLKPNPTTGVISGSVVPNDKILCGGVASTLWTITPMKDALTPISPAQQYDILSGGGTFNLASAMPTNAALAAPGFTILFGNPTASQTLTQPAGTQMTFLGTFDFTNATVLGLATSGGGGTGPFSPGAVACVPYYTGAANACDTHATLDGNGNFSAASSVSAPVFLSSGVGGVMQFPSQTAPVNFNGNPLVPGNCYVFYNTGTSLFDGVLSSGAHCIGSGGASGVAGGSLGGSYPNPTVLKFNFGATTIPLSGTAPTSGQFLKYDGSNIVGAAGGGGGSTSPACSVSGVSDTISFGAAIPATFATNCTLSNSGLVGGSFIEVRVHGVYSTNSTVSPVENIRVNAGGTTGICNHSAGNNNLATTVTNVPWDVVCYIQIVTTGTPGTAYAWGTDALSSGGGGGNGANSPHFFVNTGTVSFTTSSPQTVSVDEIGTIVSGTSLTLQALVVRNY